MEGEVFTGQGGSAPKAVDGMGFRRLYEFNLALLCKQDWKLMTEPSSLVANYQSRDYPKSKFLNSSLGTNPKLHVE